MRKKISILGSTGSIGTNTLDVVRSHPGRFEVVALSCGRNLDLFREQVLEFKPKLVSVLLEADVPKLREGLNGFSVPIVFGEEGAVKVASHADVEMVVSAMVGAAGLVPTLRAIEAKKQIALANKETMVIAGELMNGAAAKAGVKIFPVDSEHNAIFQALQGHRPQDVRRLILTASGGPFRQKTKEELENVTLEQALKHPNWSMGPKITIDSATLMNKGLEIIEARWLFDIPEEKIDVHVHPQSVVHSMVEYQDGSVIAQLGIPDMRIPIAYALSYPERLPNTLPPLDLFRVRDLNFYEPDLDRFECLKLAKTALRQGGDAPCVLNAANEVVVKAFLDGKIRFLDIPRVVGQVLREHTPQAAHRLEDLLRVDAGARAKAREILGAFQSSASQGGRNGNHQPSRSPSVN
ncbi:MAG: 1-deoxy-D-xylulose-5-phosphate reductoisomerase [bacterium]